MTALAILQVIHSTYDAIADCQRRIQQVQSASLTARSQASRLCCRHGKYVNHAHCADTVRQTAGSGSGLGSAGVIVKDEKTSSTIRATDGQPPNQAEGTALVANGVEGVVDRSELKSDIAALNNRIAELECSEARLKSKIRQKVESMKDMKVEIGQAQAEALRAEEKRESMTALVQQLEGDLERYRRWWLTDYYSLKVVLDLVPNKRDVRAIALSSQARFDSHCRQLQ